MGIGLFLFRNRAARRKAARANGRICRCAPEPVWRSLETLEPRLLLNSAPVVDLIEDKAASEAVAVALSATFTDPDVGDTHTATIDWGDGTVNSATVTSPDGVNPGTIQGSHAYADNGSYSVIVTVTDAALASGNRLFTSNITNTPPTLQISGPTTAVKDHFYTLALSSTDPGADTISQWQINWGDGNVETITGDPASVQHVYAATGSYTIAATATDEDGTYSANSHAITAALVAAPQNLVATPTANRWGEINLAWTDSSTNEAAYKIERSSDGITFAQIATTASTSYTSTSLAAGSTYYYRNTLAVCSRFAW